MATRDGGYDRYSGVKEGYHKLTSIIDRQSRQIDSLSAEKIIVETDLVQVLKSITEDRPDLVHKYMKYMQ